MLTFVYGTVGASKTLQLLLKRYQLKEKGKEVVVCKPLVGIREEKIVSRTGLSCEVDVWLPEQTTVNLWLHASDAALLYNKSAHILIDEAQFLTKQMVESIRLNLQNVTCYGLLTDFQTNIFPASQRLLELADKVVEIRTRCSYCDEPARLNMRVDAAGKRVMVGDIIQPGFNYKAVCKDHFGPLFNKQ